MEVGSSSLPGTTLRCLKAIESINVFQEVLSETHHGGLAQLARALAWHARGHRFDPDILHVCSLEHEIFDILTHKTVSKDFKLKTECIFDTTLNLQLKV